MSRFHSAEFQAAFAAAMQRRAEGHDITLVLDAGTALTLIAHIQLALRHPGNAGPSAVSARHCAGEMADHLAGDDPILREGLMAGFDSTNDVTR